MTSDMDDSSNLMTRMDDQPKHLRYAWDVAEGRIAASLPVIAQCRQSLKEHSAGEVVQNIGDESVTWVWSDYHVKPRLKFIGLCPHVKGLWANRNETIRLEPWQEFALSEIFGWHNADDPSERRYTQAILFVPRKASKTTMMAALGLFECAHADEMGAEAYVAATKKEQAEILWKIARSMIDRMNPKMSAPYQVTNAEISTKRGSFKALASKSSTQDGLNPSLAIIDEAAAVEKADQIEVVESGMGARQSPLMIFITTASSKQNTLFRSRYEIAKQNLLAGNPSKRSFNLLYELDDPSEYLDPSCWGRRSRCSESP